LNQKNKLLYFKKAFDQSEESLKQEYTINYSLYKEAIKEVKKLRKEFIDNFIDFDLDLVFFKTFKIKNPQIFKYLCKDETIQKYIRKYYFLAIKTNNISIAQSIKQIFNINDSIQKDPKYLSSIKVGALTIIKEFNLNNFVNFLQHFNINPTIAKTLDIAPAVARFIDIDQLTSPNPNLLEIKYIKNMFNL